MGKRVFTDTGDLSDFQSSDRILILDDSETDLSKALKDTSLTLLFNNIPGTANVNGGAAGEAGGIVFSVSDNSNNQVIQLKGNGDITALQGGSATVKLDFDSSAGFFALGGAATGTDGTNIFKIYEGTAPTTTAAGTFSMYAKDSAGAGTASPFFLTEDGEEIDLRNLISGTQGSIFFASSIGAPTEDNSNLFWDDTLNRLGVGTNTPNYSIETTGVISANSNQTSLSEITLKLGSTFGKIEFGSGNFILQNTTGFVFHKPSGQYYGFGAFTTTGTSDPMSYCHLWINTTTANEPIIGSRTNSSTSNINIRSANSGVIKLQQSSTTRHTFGRNYTISDGFITLPNPTTPPTSTANNISLYSKDLSAGNTMLAIQTEGTPTGIGTPTQDTTIAIDINGTTYYILASTTAT